VPDNFTRDHTLMLGLACSPSVLHLLLPYACLKKLCRVGGTVLTWGAR